MNILHIIPSLNYSGAGRQLGLLCRGLAGSRWNTQVCVLGKDVSGTSLLGADTPIHVLGQSRRLDLVALWRFRRLVRSYQPDIIHSWGFSALRFLAFAGHGKSRLVVVGASLFSQPLTMLDRWLLNRADRIVVRGQAEAKRCALAGLNGDGIAVIPPGIDQAFFPQNPTPFPSRTLPARKGPVVFCAGSLEPHKGYRDAIWALDILRFLYPDIHLNLAGSGPERQRLETFVQRNGISVNFLGRRGDMPALLAQAQIVWIPSVADAGVQIALEAMAAGKPMIATNMSSLRQIITDGQTGFLIPPGDKVALARRTRELLSNPDLSKRIGQTAWRHAQAFSAENFVNRTVNLYQELAAEVDMPAASITYSGHKAYKAA
jgi:glycosyltransferase involved in cell wall biosynthesis